MSVSKHAQDLYKAKGDNPTNAVPKDFRDEAGENHVPEHLREDPFFLTRGEYRELGIEPEEFTHTYVRNPSEWKARGDTDRIKEMKRNWPGSSVVLDSNDEMVTVHDMCLMKVPKALVEGRDADLRADADDYVKTNPLLALEAGYTPDEVMALLESRGHPDVVEARRSAYDLQDRERRRELVRQAEIESAQRRRLRTSPTFGMTYEQAVRQEVGKIQRSNPKFSDRQAMEVWKEQVFGRELEAANPGRKNERITWKDDLKRASGGRSYGFGDTGFGINKNSPLAAAMQRGEKQQQTGGRR